MTPGQPSADRERILTQGVDKLRRDVDRLRDDDIDVSYPQRFFMRTSGGVRYKFDVSAGPVLQLIDDAGAGTVIGPAATYLRLATDYNNALDTFATITDGTTILTFTPPANTNWEMEARLLVWTTAVANLPRVGFLVAAGATRGYGGVNIWQAGESGLASVHANGAWSDAAGITVAQLPAGGVLTASVPYICEVIASGRSGATPTAISLQMACETAAAATCFIKRGSFMKYRTFP